MIRYSIVLIAGGLGVGAIVTFIGGPLWAAAAVGAILGAAVGAVRVGVR